MRNGWLLGNLFTAAAVVVGGQAHAFPGGISGYSGNPGTNGGNTCTQCHGGGSNPTVTLSGPGTVAPGSTSTFSLKISGGQQAFGALDVSATAGALAAFEAGTKLSSGEITHTTRKAVDASGSVTFQFHWQAPATPGSATLYGAGLSANGDGGTRGDGSAKATLSVTVESPPAGNQAPTAVVGGPYAGTTGQAIQFDGSRSSDSDGQIASFDWDFGDGSKGTGSKPTHAYAVASSYTVKLTVTDDGGKTGSATTTARVTDVPAGNEAPTAVPGGPYAGNVGQSVQLDGSLSSDPDGQIVSFDWDFGDGSTGSGDKPAHAYASAGSYTVTLTVTDDGGLGGSATTTATISEVSQGGPVSLKVSGTVRVREGRTRRINIVAMVGLDPAGLTAGAETCGAVHLLKDGEEVGVQTFCVTVKAPGREDEGDDVGNDHGGDADRDAGDDSTGDDGPGDDRGSHASTSDSGARRIEASGLRLDATTGGTVRRTVRFKAEVTADDAPSIEWAAFVEIDGVASASSTATTEVVVKPAGKSRRSS